MTGLAAAGAGILRRPMLLVLAGTLLLVPGCRKVENGAGVAGPSPEELAGRRIRAVATTGMVADLVARVGGERVAVTGLMGPGVDPHLYKASEGDVIRMAAADVVFYNGLHLEGKMGEVFERMGGGVRTVAVTDGVARERLLRPPEFAGAYDPHVWFDVTLWMEAAGTVADALIAMDPAHADRYRADAKRYLEELAALDAYVRRRAEEVPPRRRVLITAHDAFNYFGRAYGFTVRGLQGISTAAEAGAADIQDLARLIVTNRIPAAFVETSVPPRYIEALKEAVEARGFDLEIGGNLYSDALGEPGTPAGTYAGMVRHNIDTIVAALAKPPRAERGARAGGTRHGAGR